MLTLKFITDNKEEVIKRLAKKHFDAKEIIEQVLETDKIRKNSQTTLDANQANLNQLSKSIGQLMKDGNKEEAETARNKVAEIKEGNKGLETAMKDAEQKLIELL